MVSAVRVLVSLLLDNDLILALLGSTAGGRLSHILMLVLVSHVDRGSGQGLIEWLPRANYLFVVHCDYHYFRLKFLAYLSNKSNNAAIAKQQPNPLTMLFKRQTGMPLQGT